jgi:hypothetical protein
VNEDTDGLRVMTKADFVASAKDACS